MPDKKKKATTKTQGPAIPERLKGIWSEWVQSRKENKHPLTATAVSRQLKRLEAYDTATAIKVIELSIMNGYQGLIFDRFPLKSPGTPKVSAMQQLQEARRRTAEYGKSD